MTEPKPHPRAYYKVLELIRERMDAELTNAQHEALALSVGDVILGEQRGGDWHDSRGSVLEHVHVTHPPARLRALSDPVEPVQPRPSAADRSVRRKARKAARAARRVGR